LITRIEPEALAGIEVQGACPAAWVRLPVSRMHLAVGNLVDGIVALCGGVMQCGICHCYIADEWTAKGGGPSEDEVTMLEALEGVELRASSRLSCQIQLGEELDGLVVEVSKDQAGV